MGGVEKRGPVGMPLPNSDERSIGHQTLMKSKNTPPKFLSRVALQFVNRVLRSLCRRLAKPPCFSICKPTLHFFRVQGSVCLCVWSSPTWWLTVSTWTLCGRRLAPRRANEGYTAEPSVRARLVCSAYHRHPGRTANHPPQRLDSLTPDAHRAGATPPLPRQTSER